MTASPSLRAARVVPSTLRFGQLAVRNGTTAQGRDLGQKMIDDHTKVNDQLKPIALREGIRLPTDVARVAPASVLRPNRESNIERA
jgi:hypothetical protein